MSFGFSVGDFIAAIELANKVRRDFVDAPGQFKAISDECVFLYKIWTPIDGDCSNRVRSLSIVLQDADIAFQEQELNDDYKQDLEDIDQGCRNVLNDLQQILNKNSELRPETGSVGKRIKRVWKRLHWKPEDIDELRSRITTNIGLPNAFNGRLTRGNVIKLVRHQDGQERQSILDWLTLIDYTHQQNDFINRRQKGTGQWLLDSVEYQAWLNSYGQTLFCPGIPGAGKTILASIVINDLHERFRGDSTIGIAYIYFNFRRQDEQKPDGIFASLLRQLSQERPLLVDSVKALYAYHKEKRTRPSLGEILGVLQSVATTYSKVFIVIDALDECPISDGSRQRLLSSLFNLQIKCGINLLATSRHILSIKEEFEGKTMLEIRASEADVRRYLEGHMFRLPGFVVRNPELQEEIKTGIVKAVDGMFLLAQLHLDSLTGKRAPKAVRTALNNLTTGSEAYDHAYEDAMERINGQVKDQVELAKQALWWITCARRQLTTSELRHALAVEVGESQLDEDNLPEVEDIVSEYFTRTQNHWFPDAEINITTVCITYLSFDVFESGFCKTYYEFEERLGSNQFFEYAAQNWGHHARKISNLNQVLRQSILDFLKSEAKVEASSQGLLERRRDPWTAYGQAPLRIMGLHLTAYFGANAVIQLLLDTGNINTDSKDTNGRTPLFWAAGNGHEAVVQLLATSTIDINSKDNRGRMPLLWAAGNGHGAVVRRLLETGKVDANSEDKNSVTPLLWAALFGHEAVLRLLLETGKAEADSKDKGGRTPLSWVAEFGHEAVARLLLETGKAEADSKNNGGKTPLSWAAEFGHEAIVRLLLETGKVDINSKDNNNLTPLMWTVKNRHKNVFKLLLEHGAKHEPTDNNG